MKKLFIILLTCLLFTPLWAQKATLKDLQGKWTLVTYATLNASLDIKSGKAALTEAAKSLGPGITNSLITDMENYAKDLESAYVEIEGNNYMQVIYDTVKAGPFTISDKEDYQVIDAQFDDGTTGTIYFLIRDSKLILYFPQSSKRYTYKKQS